MTLVIRPSPAVFAGEQKLLVVFGAFLKVEDCHYGGQQTTQALADVVADARKFRVPVAFCRARMPGRSRDEEMCQSILRPSIRDRIFDLDTLNAFDNPAFVAALEEYLKRGVILCGDASDSIYRTTIRHLQTQDLNCDALSPRLLMQKCSAHGWSSEFSYKPAAQLQASQSAPRVFPNNVHLVE